MRGRKRMMEFGMSSLVSATTFAHLRFDAGQTTTRRGSSFTRHGESLQHDPRVRNEPGAGGG